MATPNQDDLRQLVFVRHEAGDVVVRCPFPDCRQEGRLMQDFSLLKAGFNGIKSGDPDDCGLQECGSCGRRAGHDNLPDAEEEDET